MPEWCNIMQYWCFLQQSCPTCFEREGNQIGNASLQERKDEAFAAAVREGISWTVVSWTVAEKYPEFARLCQAAGNSIQQVARFEGELQVARKVLTSIINIKKKTGRSDVTWSEVKEEVLRSKPPNSASLPLVFLFVLRFSGDLAGCSCMCCLLSGFRSCLLKPCHFLLKDMWICK